MFITSTFSIIRSRSLWPNFNTSAILPCILKTISWINVILGILVRCDTTIDIIINVGHLDLYFMVQWFCLVSWMLFDIWTSLFGIMNQYTPTVDLKVNLGNCNFMWHLEANLMYDYHSLGLWVSTTQHFNIKCRSMWPIFHSLVILSYISHCLMPKCHIYRKWHSVTQTLTSK